MKSMSVRFDDKVKEALDESAKEDSRSQNSYIVQAVKEKIERQKKAKC